MLRRSGLRTSAAWTAVPSPCGPGPGTRRGSHSRAPETNSTKVRTRMKLSVCLQGGWRGANFSGF